ncbi:hypothetical protein XaraCFBP7407_14870 [Xanthomonas arboricola pv. arracaciae]|nr:hypothetical protein XaraCFBP7407_14870 [Xanthomonas arboricola pv. arracaciae]
MLPIRQREHKPRRVDLYEIWCAVLYVLRTCCQLLPLPSTSSSGGP